MSNGATSDYGVNGTREICGPFANLRIEAVNSTQDAALGFHDTSSEVEVIVSGSAAVCLRGSVFRASISLSHRRRRCSIPLQSIREILMLKKVFLDWCLCCFSSPLQDQPSTNSFSVGELD